MLQRKTCGLHSSLCKLLWSEFQTEGSPSVNKMDKADTQNVWEHVSIVALRYSHHLPGVHSATTQRYGKQRQTEEEIHQNPKICPPLPACPPWLTLKQSGLDEGSAGQVWEVSLHTGQLIRECIQYRGLFSICLSNTNTIKKGIVLNPPF